MRDGGGSRNVGGYFILSEGIIVELAPGARGCHREFEYTVLCGSSLAVWWAMCHSDSPNPCWGVSGHGVERHCSAVATQWAAAQGLCVRVSRASGRMRSESHGQSSRSSSGANG